MNKVVNSAVVVAGLVCMLGRAVSWGDTKPTINDFSDGNDNTAGGTGALQQNTQGAGNTAFGATALAGNTTGNDNTAVGINALFTTSTGGGNTAVGAAALYKNTGSDNTAVGTSALLSNTTGSDNTAVGFNVLVGNTTGYLNTASGDNALQFNTTGLVNTASGAFALIGNTTGYRNTASGYQALASNTTGFVNTGEGSQALAANTNGAYNVALGYRALYNSTGSRNLALGFNAGFHLSSGDNNIYLGSTGVATEVTTMRLGSVQTRTFIVGVYNVPLSSGNFPVQVFIDKNGQLGKMPSSARYKRDIEDMREHSQGLYRLRPVTFHYTQDPHGPRQYGLIAEEVVTVYPELVTKGADGKVESVQYHELIPMLLNEVQSQQQEITELKAQARQVEELKAQNAALAARLERLEQAATRTATAATR